MGINYVTSKPLLEIAKGIYKLLRKRLHVIGTYTPKGFTEAAHESVMTKTKTLKGIY